MWQVYARVCENVHACLCHCCLHATKSGFLRGGPFVCLKYVQCDKIFCDISNSYTMGCPPVRGDNPRALASGLSYVQVDKHSITNLYHIHQCRPCTSRDISC